MLSLKNLLIGCFIITDLSFSVHAAMQKRDLNPPVNHLKTHLSFDVLKKDKIMEHYAQWKGVHYLWGGMTKSGVDCSAFIQFAFKDKFHIQLPRTTAEQIKKGKFIKRKKIRTGDLIFFKTSAKDRHVGIYVEQGNFIHASSSHGVTMSSLENKYWSRHYESARRVDFIEDTVS